MMSIDMESLMIEADDLKLLHHKFPTSALLTKIVKHIGKEGEVFFFAACHNYALLERKSVNLR